MKRCEEPREPRRPAAPAGVVGGSEGDRTEAEGMMEEGEARKSGVGMGDNQKEGVRELKPPRFVVAPVEDVREGGEKLA